VTCPSANPTAIAIACPPNSGKEAVCIAATELNETGDRSSIYMHSLDTPAEINHSRALSTTIPSATTHKATSIYYSCYHIDHKQIEMDSHFCILQTIRIYMLSLSGTACIGQLFHRRFFGQQNSLEIRSGMLARGGSYCRNDFMTTSSMKTAPDRYQAISGRHRYQDISVVA
jgi:hypothetical protein